MSRNTISNNTKSSKFINVRGKSLYQIQKHNHLVFLEHINQKIYQFYLNRKDHLSEYQIKRELWNTELWREGKSQLLSYNKFRYGKTICEICNEGFYSYNPFRASQVHHIKIQYNWEKVFDPGLAIIVHKHCHKLIHNIKRDDTIG